MVANPGGPSLKKPCYLYGHTINEYNNTPIPETVIYVGISIAENTNTNVKSFQSKFARAFNKTESGRSLLWHGVVDNSGGHKVHIFPIRLESQPCNDLEIRLMDILGRFCIAELYQGPLVNVARVNHDPYRLRENNPTLPRSKNNPQMLGKGGVYSMQVQIMRADEDHRAKTSKEGRKRFSEKSIEKKDRFFAGNKKY